MSVLCGSFTGEGTPLNQRTGRTQAYRSNSWRNATLRDRIPPPTGVVSGPLIPTRYFLNASIVSSGIQLFTFLNDFSPARTSFHWIDRLPLYAFSTAASNTSLEAGQISTPVPSPSIKGITGLSGTTSLPLLMLICPASDKLF